MIHLVVRDSHMTQHIQKLLHLLKAIGDVHGLAIHILERSLGLDSQFVHLNESTLITNVLVTRLVQQFQGDL